MPQLDPAVIERFKNAFAGALAEARARIVYERRHELLGIRLDKIQEADAEGVVQGELTAIRRDKLEAATQRAGRRDYAGATDLIAEGEQAAAQAAQLLDTWRQYGEALKQAQQAVTPLTQPAISNEVAAIRRDLIDPAVTLASQRDFEGALVPLGKVAGACLAATRRLEELRVQYESTLETAEKALTALPQKMVASTVTSIRDDKISRAKADAQRFDYAPALVLLEDAIKAAASALQLVETERKRYEQALQGAEQELGKLNQPVIADDVKQIRDDLVVPAATAATQGDYPEGSRLLGGVASRCDAARKVAEAHALYEKAVLDAESLLGPLTQKVIAKDVAAIRTTKVKPAAEAIKTRDYPTAMTNLAGVAPLAATAAGRAERYAKALTIAQNQVTNAGLRDPSAITYWTIAPLPGISGVLADVQTNLIDAATTAANGSDYDGAMALLEQVLGRVTAYHKVFSDYLSALNPYYTNLQLLTAAWNTATSGFTTAPEPIKADIVDLNTSLLDPAKLLISGGQYLKAAAHLQPFAARHALIQTRLGDYGQVEAKLGPAKVKAAEIVDPDLSSNGTNLKLDLITAAEGEVVAGRYPAALALLAKVEPEVGVVQAYGLKLKAAKQLVATLTEPVIADDKARIQRDRVDAAVQASLARDYVKAEALLAGVADECAAAKKVATANGLAVTARSGAQSAIDQVETARDAALKAVQDLLDALKQDHGAVEAIKVERAAIQVEIDTAGVEAGEGKNSEAAARLGKAADRCVKARLVAERDVQYAAALKAAKSTLAQRTEPVIADDVKKIQQDNIDKAGVEALNGRYDVAMPLLIAVDAACLAARRVAEAHAAYEIALNAAKAELLLPAVSDPLVAKIKAKIQTDLVDEAAKKVAPNVRDYPAAMTLLAAVKPTCDQAAAIVPAHADYNSQLLKTDTAFNSFANKIKYFVSNSMPQPEASKAETQIKNTLIDVAKAAATKAVQDHIDKGSAAGVAKMFIDATAQLAEAEKRAKTEEGALDAQYYAVDLMTQSDNELKAVETSAGASAIDVELKALRKMWNDGIAMRTAGHFDAVVTIASNVHFALPAIDAVGKAWVVHDGLLGAAKIRHGTASSAVSGLTSVVAPISAALARIETELIVTAEAQGNLRNFAAAAELLKPVDSRCAAVESYVADHKKYALALTAAQQAVALLKDPTIAGDAARIQDERITPAEQRAAALDYAAALALLACVKGECDAATLLVTGQTETERGRVEAQRAIDTVTTDQPAALAAVEKLLKTLTDHAAAPAIKKQTDAIADQIKQARSATPDLAGPLLTAAAKDCVPARVLADRHVALTAALKVAELRVAGLVHAAITEDAKAITKSQIEPAKLAITDQDHPKATALIEAVEPAALAAERVASDADAYDKALKAAKAAKGELDTLKQSDVLALNQLQLKLAGYVPPLNPTQEADKKKDENDKLILEAQRDSLAVTIKKIDDDHIAEADKKVKSPQRAYAEATALLGRVGPLVEAEKLKHKLAGNANPTQTEIDDLIAKPGGEQLLDELIKQLPPTTQRGVVREAINARFNIKLDMFSKDAVPKDVLAPKTLSLKKIYELMGRVPDSHTRDNPSLKKIERYGGSAMEKVNIDRGNFYRPSDKTVVLSCGRARDRAPQPMANRVFALPDVEPDCEMVPDSSSSPAPEYFDWTTLHEVGHAIDDKKMFMNSKADDPAFAAWQTHGRDVAAVAAAAAAHHAKGALSGTQLPVYEAYIVAYLLKSSPSAPPPPGGLNSVVWDGLLQTAREWCDAVRVGKELWEVGSETKKRALGARVYHEAYPGTWVSYLLAARTRGVTGYQFRAPGEWLAELYAAYYSDKLKDTHPANSWLETL